jgi:glutathione S-transferase
MAITVFGDSISGNCLKVKWTLDRLAIPYEWRETSVLAGDTRTPAFLRLNAAGQAPVVVLEDGRSLAQSNAILVHFAEGSDLIPADPYLRAKMFEWLFWEQYSHEPYIAVRRFQLAYAGKRPEELDPRLFERGSAALQRMDEALAGRAYLVGEALSLADIALVAYTRFADQGGFDLGLYPNVARWVARIDAELGIEAQPALA